MPRRSSRRGPVVGIVLALLTIFLGRSVLDRPAPKAGGTTSSVPNGLVRIIKVADGDTLTGLTADKAQVKIRMFGIDAPEKKQAFGERSRQWMSDRVFGKDVRLEGGKKDRYGRTVATVFLGGREVNLESVQAGMSWYYAEYAKKRTDLRDAEVEARRDRRGLWADRNPTPPWEWRKTERDRR